MNSPHWPTTRLSILLAVKDPANDLAWQDFVDHYRGPIVALCERRGLDLHAAEDVAQRILLRLLSSMRSYQYDPKSSFRAWLKTVVRNAVVDFFRADGRRLDRAVGSLTTDTLRAQDVILPSDEEALADQLNQELQMRLLDEAEASVRNRLRNPQTWEAYCARKKGVPAREVAAGMNMSLAAVHKAKTRVMDLIRQEIAAMTSSRPTP